MVLWLRWQMGEEDGGKEQFQPHQKWVVEFFYLFLFHDDGTLKIEPTIILARLQLAKHRCKVFNKKMILQSRSFRHICETKLRVIPAHRHAVIGQIR